MHRQGPTRRGAGGALAVMLALASAHASADALHVPSPDWRDQVIYFVMTDRFDDGDASNNDQGAGEYDPADSRRYSGGDLRGITRRLDYVRGLGATALWITPPVANQWWNPETNYGGYHGYWAEHFMQVDAHAGSLEDYRDLSRALHRAGLYLVQDIVVNHTANYFAYDRWNEYDPAHGFRRIADSRGRNAPTQPPFDRNDARDAAQRAQGIYHWTPDISDYNDLMRLPRFQLAGLDDLATDNPVVRDALRASYGFWIREVGVDAFRVDTAFYVSPDYFEDFLHADDARAPGIARVAAGTGRDAFHVFGEGFATDRAYEDTQARRIDAYMRADTARTGPPSAATPHEGTGTEGGGTEDGPDARERDPTARGRLPGMLNFPLYQTLGDVFARGRPTAELAHRIDSMMRVHARPHLMPTFIDNHDVDRFLASGSDAALRQALLAMLTLPGIPTIYYGTEQGFTAPRASMFAGGHGSGGRDHFDTDAPLYRYLQRAIALRRGHPVFSRGVPTVLASSRAAPGPLAYRMTHDGAQALVAFNTDDAPALLHVATGLPTGTRLQAVFDIDAPAGDAAVAADGTLTLVLPPRAGRVWLAGAADAPPTQAPAPRIDAGVATRARGDVAFSGHARPGARVRLVADGRIQAAPAIRADARGRWRATLSTADFIDPAIEHEVRAWDEAGGRVSAPVHLHVQREWTGLARQTDPAGDDAGPDGRYRYPTDPGWGEARLLDLREVVVSGSGGAMRIDLQLPAVAALWNPANGFDHVAFTVFIGLPDEAGGATVMPQQNASLPGGMRWHRRLRAHGWSNAMFSSEGATASHEGTPVAPGARLEVDREAGRVSFVIPAAALGHPATLSGAEVYVATWDYDGGYRGLAPVAEPMRFGGGDGARDPLVMDDARVVLP